jgi:hypothetical protein
MNNSLKELRYPNGLPLAFRKIYKGLVTAEQIAARAADTIEQLEKELADARAALWSADLEDWRFVSSKAKWRHSHAAALQFSSPKTNAGK